MEGATDKSFSLLEALDAYLHGRPVQQVIAGNVTLEEAEWFVDQLRLNRTGKTTAFLLDVTDEVYTLGVPAAVLALTPNATVANSRNESAANPPAPPWPSLFNAIAGVAQVLWDAATAVAQFFKNLVKFLADLVVGLVIGLATGNSTSRGRPMVGGGKTLVRDLPPSTKRSDGCEHDTVFLRRA